MSGLVFETAPPIVASAPNRSDIACFIGFVSRRKTALPSQLERWLQEQGWNSPGIGRFTRFACADRGVESV